MRPRAWQVDEQTGTLSPPGVVSQRRLRELAGSFINAAKQGGADSGLVIYRVEEPEIPHEEGHLTFCTTLIHPGEVAGEPFMTRGHRHVKESGEVYLGMAGSGWMLMQDRDGEARHERIAGNRVIYVPPGWAHRTVNDGTEDLLFLAIRPGDAGHDYEGITFREIVLGGGDGTEGRIHTRERG